MKDFTGPLTLIDVRNTGFIGMDMLNKANVGPINPEKGWLVLWQEGRKDENGNDVPTSVSNVAILEKGAVVNEVLKCLTNYGLSKEFEITNLDDIVQQRIYASLEDLYFEKEDPLQTIDSEVRKAHCYDRKETAMSQPLK